MKKKERIFASVNNIPDQISFLDHFLTLWSRFSGEQTIYCQTFIKKFIIERTVYQESIMKNQNQW